jgi:glycogen debranching enzyme
MFSGWGWRTMSQQEQVFNPLSYHRGSVWPHDNSLIAHGMSLNEFREPALRLLTAEAMHDIAHFLRPAHKRERREGPPITTWMAWE